MTNWPGRAAAEGVGQPQPFGDLPFDHREGENPDFLEMGVTGQPEAEDPLFIPGVQQRQIAPVNHGLTPIGAEFS